MNTTNQIVQVKIEDIVPNRYQPRLNFNDQDLTELASSIRQYGIIQPLTLRPFDTKFEIIAGERRYRAAKLLGMQTVPAIIMNINDPTSAELALVENLQRKNLNAIEEARAYKKILDIENITQEELAKKIGKTQTTISNKIRLLDLASEVQNAVLNNQISERHARTILKLNNFESQKEVLQKIISEKLTVKLTEELIISNYKKDILNFNNIGDDKEMNEQNYNTLTNQPTGTIPETPLPQEQPQQQTNSMFNNNFFPSLEDEKTNMELNPWNAPTPEQNAPSVQTPEVPQIASNPSMEQAVNPWEMPVTNIEQPAPTDLQTNNSPLDFSAPRESISVPEQVVPNLETNNEQNGLNNNFTQTTTETPNLDFGQQLNNNQQPTEFVSPTPDNLSINEHQNINNNIQTPLPQPELQTQNFTSTSPVTPSQDQFNNPLPGFIDQQSFNQSNSTPNPNQSTNINELVPMIRKAISEIDPTGSKIQTSELDLDNEYQITIKISKGSI